MRFLVTAGPTREYIDPVRFISNPSTGEIGYQIARAARKAGHRVALITGPSTLKPPAGVALTRVTSAREMFKAVMKGLRRADCLVMTSAVSDFRPAVFSNRKMSRMSTLRLVRNPDILLEAGKKKGNRIHVGFAMQTESLLKNAARKMRSKNLDMIVANRVTGAKKPFGCAQDRPFGNTPVRVLVLDRDGGRQWLGPAPKQKIAQFLVDKIGKLR